jgi:fatty acid-binding protein DegV
MAVCSSTTVDDAIQLEQRLTPFLADGAKSFQTRFGPVVGTHVGPDAVGIAVLIS